MFNRVNTLRLSSNIRKLRFSACFKMSKSEKLLPGCDFSKAMVRNLVEQNRMELKFKYANPQLGLDNWFSFSRSLDESVQQLVQRLINNIEKASLKFLKRQKKKQTQSTSVEDWKVTVKVMHNLGSVDTSINCRQLLQLSDVKILVVDKFFHFDIDPPLVKTLKLPESIMAGFPVYLSKVEVDNCEVEQCQMNWFCSPGAKAPDTDSVDEWTHIGSGFFYVPSNEHIGCWLKLECLPKNNGREGWKESVVSSQTVSAGPGICPFEVRHNFTKEAVLDPCGFRVVTYNILADLYADSDYTRTVLHPYCPPYALAIDYRKQLILKELIGYNADIICLQEVDSKVFDRDLQPTFAGLGFQGVFNKKGGQVSEGLSCIFSTQRFRMVESFSYILSEQLQNNELLGDVWRAVQQNENLAKRIIARTTTLQLVVLETVDESKRLIVANTHLYFHPDADHIRLLQATMALRLAEDLHKSHSTKCENVSLVFCGDFNSCPGYGVLELMTEQFIHEDYNDWSSNSEEAVRGFSARNNIAMGSACGTPTFTNYSSGFHGCLDYIFYERSKLTVDQVIPLPSLEEVTQHTALPSIVFPSDHISLVVDLKWL